VDADSFPDDDLDRAQVMPAPPQVIGQLVIGDMAMDIESVEFIDGIMRVHCTLGIERAGRLYGLAHIRGADGQVAWRGTKMHDLGTKASAAVGLGGSTWTVAFDADLMDRTSASITARFDLPDPDIARGIDRVLGQEAPWDD
jgi:hypothetical protein